MAQLLPPPRLQLDHRALRESTAEARWSREVASLAGHRGSSCNASDHSSSSQLWSLPVHCHVVSQHLHRKSPCRSYRGTRRLLPCDCGRWNFLVRLTVSNTRLASPAYPAAQPRDPEVLPYNLSPNDNPSRSYCRNRCSKLHRGCV